MSRIGPTLPPNFQNQHSDENSSDGDDAYGPALPPHLLAKSSSDTVASSSCSATFKDVDTTSSRHSDEAGQTSSDDEVIGPLPPVEGKDSYSCVTEVEERSNKMKRKLLGYDDEGNEKEVKREEWMVELPELHRKNFGLGPRTFNRSDKPECTERDQWTSTPNSQPSTSKSSKDKEESLKKAYLEQKRNIELEKIVDKHDKKKRSKTLLELHQKELKRRKKEEESKPKERKPFDRDEDLKLNKMDDAKRKALIKRSLELNSKFKIGSQKFL